LFYSWNFIINNIQKELFKDLRIDQMQDTCDQECQSRACYRAATPIRLLLTMFQ
jgi:hypothetical protein